MTDPAPSPPASPSPPTVPALAQTTVAGPGGAPLPSAACVPASGPVHHPSPVFLDAQIDSLLQAQPPATHHRRYQIEGMIGVGATGEVYAVHDGSLERVVAIKLLRPQLAGDANEIASFIAEARITAQLAHPNVLPVHDVNVAQDGRPFFSMGRIKGTILGQAILDSEQGPRVPGIASMNAVVSIFISVCNAVNYAHHLGIIHQDIKPDNILIGEFGEVLLLDWGSAGRIDGDGRVRAHIYGTPLYMSPEQARQQYSDARSDIFCIGASLFHALLLRYPTWSEDGDRFWAMKQAGTITEPTAQERQSVPAELLAISLKAMQADPALRYQSVESLKNDLVNYQGGLAVSAKRDTLMRSLARWYARNKYLFWLGATVLVLLGILCGMVLHMRLAQEGAWIEVFQEHFDEGDKAALGARWQVRMQHSGGSGEMHDVDIGDSPCVTLLDSILQIRTTDAAFDLVCKQVVRGNFRVSWDVAAQGQARNLNCFIGADRQSGFTFHIGGWGDPSSVILTQGGNYDRLEEAHLEQPLLLGRVYHMSLEREQRHLRLSIDGHTYIDYIDAENIGGEQGQTFGFDSFLNNRITLDNIIVYRQAIAQIVSPVEVGDKLFMLHNYVEAERQYREISETYPGTELDRSCRYRIALCERREGRLRDAGQTFDSFAASFPDHELAPYALFQRLQLALEAKDDRSIHRVMTAMIGYRGTPVLSQVLDEYGLFKSNFLPLGKVTTFPLPDLYRADLESYVSNVMTELRSWSELYDVPLWANPFIDAAYRALAQDGAPESSLEEVSNSPERREEMLLYSGRYQEIVDMGLSDDLTGRALIWMGRAREVAHSPAYSLQLRAMAYLTIGDFDGLRHHAADPEHYGDSLLVQGRYAQVLAEVGSDPILSKADGRIRLRALLATKQYDRMQVPSGDFLLDSLALRGRGKRDEAILASPANPVVIGIAAIDDLEDGAPGTAAPLLERLQDQTGQGRYQEFMFASYLLPEMIDALHGDRARAEVLWRKRLANKPDLFGTRLRYLVDYITGASTDQTFLSQPSQLRVQSTLLMAKGLKLDFAGDSAHAALAYQKALAQPAYTSFFDDATVAFMQWRIRAAGLIPPDYAIVGGILP